MKGPFCRYTGLFGVIITLLIDARHDQRSVQFNSESNECTNFSTDSNSHQHVGLKKRDKFREISRSGAPKVGVAIVALDGILSFKGVGF
jgi:hypothetical protein